MHIGSKKRNGNWGRKLPPEYVERMLRENGGVARIDGQTWELYPIRDVSDKRRLKRTCNHVVRETAGLRGLPNFPAEGQTAAAICCYYYQNPPRLMARPCSGGITN